MSTSKSSSRTEVKATPELEGTEPTATAAGTTEKKRRVKKGERTAAKTYRRRSPGFTNRRHRRDMEKAVIRARLLDSRPELDGEALEAAVDADYERLLPTDPKVTKCYEETTPVSACPDRRKLFDFVEAKAIRALPEMVDLEQRLRVSSYGRPTDRRLPVATFERNILEKGRPEIFAHCKDFGSANEPIAWAYDWPARDGSQRDASNVYRTLHSTLLRVSPDICLQLNLQAFARLRAELGDPDIGRALLIDGTPIVAPREQRASDPAYPVEEQYLRRGLSGAEFTTHGGRKTWRGYKLIYLVDIKTGLPLAFVLLSGTRPEWEGLEEMLLKIHEHWERYVGEPWEPEYLVGDAHFDNDRVHRMLEERFAIHPVFPRGTPLGSDWKWHDNEGTPYCAKHGDMKLKQADDFVGHAKRRAIGLVPGEPADLSDARLRWSCPTCGIKAETRWHHNPRAYTYLPFKGEHINRIAMRKALMLRRNMAESLNARLKGRGIGNGGMNVPRWVSTDQEMRWLCYGTSLAFTLQRLAHQIGAYDHACQEADLRELLRPCQPSPTPVATLAGTSSTGGLAA